MQSNNQIASIAVKLELPNHRVKRVKTPLTFNALLAKVTSLAQHQRKDLTEVLTVHFVDFKGE